MSAATCSPIMSTYLVVSRRKNNHMPGLTAMRLVRKTRLSGRSEVLDTDRATSTSRFVKYEKTKQIETHAPTDGVGTALFFFHIITFSADRCGPSLA